jgi:two-component system, cell cycle sensor histidine kinase and response regulator CckA
MKRILVVEDHVGVGNVIAACLASYDVTVTHNGPEALARASQLSACDLLITDYLMPCILGDEVARRLRVMHPAAKTLLLTGYAESVSFDRTAVDAQMAKPFAPDTLRATVKHLIGNAVDHDVRAAAVA